MNHVACQAIIDLLERTGVPFTSITHEPCKTSEESERARAAVGYPGIMGAKALLAKLYFKTEEKFATIVLPGAHVLDRTKLLADIPELKKIRFATPEEMLALAGVVPGCMPPFATPIFPHIPLLIVAEALKKYERIGFNAAYFEKSILLSSSGYLSAVTPDFVSDCSIPKVVTESDV